MNDFSLVETQVITETCLTFRDIPQRIVSPLIIVGVGLSSFCDPPPPKYQRH
jgi:hypothetical protein